MKALYTLFRSLSRRFEEIHKIRSQMFFSYFIIILLCISIIGIVSYYYSNRSVRELTENANIQIVNQIQKSMDQDFQNKRDTLLAPYFNSDYLNGINSYNKMNANEQYLFNQELGDLYLKSFYVAPRMDFVRFSVYYANGDLMYTSGERAYANVEEADWFKNAVSKSGKIYFSGSYDDSLSERDRRLFSSSLVIRDFSSVEEFIVVQAEYNFKLLDNISKNSNLSENSQIVIFDDAGEIVYATEVMDNSELYDEVSNQISSARGAFWLDIKNQDRVQVSHLRLQQAAWDIVLITPQKDIMGASEKIKKITIGTVLFAFIVTSLTSIWFSGRITKPILHIHQVVNRIKRGDLSIRVQTKGNNEVSRIGINFNDMVDELQSLINTKYIYQIQLREAELAMLYSQINPHFLYNTLDSIRAMAKHYKIEDVADMSSALADMFRYNIRNDKEWVTIRDEIGQLRDYVTIQQIRFGDKINVEWKVDESVWDAEILKMTLQPLAENAIFHGLERIKGKGQLLVECRREAELLCIVIEDNGKGMSPDQLDHIKELLARSREVEVESLNQSMRTGIGLNNVYSRYEIRYGNDFRFAIDSVEEEGTTVVIRIPLRIQESEI